MDDLKEIVARALQRSGFKADERDAADLIDALRDPPASVIEAGAKALYLHSDEEGYTPPAWAAMGEDARQWWRDADVMLKLSVG